MPELLKQTDMLMGFQKNATVTSLETFDNEPGFYRYVIRPMLTPGHEGELVNWLKDIGLLARSVMCVQSDKDESCNSPLLWTTARNKDNYRWKCGSCKKHRPIRVNSVFHNVPCTLKDAVRILSGWCKGSDTNMLAEMLDLKTRVVQSLYKQCIKIAADYVLTHVAEWKLGGPGTVVVVEMYPDGCSKADTTNQQYNNNAVPILCMAEVKTIPTKYWFHKIDPRSMIRDVIRTNDEAIHVLKQVVAPGSILVVDPNAKLCSYVSLKSLPEYPLVISTDDLMRHNTSLQNLVDNLAVIWGPALDICEEAQDCAPNEMQNFLYSRMWKNRYGSESLQYLLNQMSYPNSC